MIQTSPTADLRIKVLKAHAACLRSGSESYQIEAEIARIKHLLNGLSEEASNSGIGVELRQAESSLTVALNDKKEEHKTWATIHDTYKLWEDNPIGTTVRTGLTPAQRLRKLADETDADMPIESFEEKHISLFRQMEEGGISRPFFWICYRTGRDPDRAGDPLEKVQTNED